MLSLSRGGLSKMVRGQLLPTTAVLFSTVSAKERTGDRWRDGLYVMQTLSSAAREAVAAFRLASLLSGSECLGDGAGFAGWSRRQPTKGRLHPA